MSFSSSPQKFHFGVANQIPVQSQVQELTFTTIHKKILP